MASNIAVIGAGMTGITAARALRAHGHHVVIFDKSRGLGGRIATRRAHGLAINHGAGALLAKSSEFEDVLARYGAARDPLGAWTRVSGMSSIIRSMADGLEIHGERRVSGVEAGSNGLRLHFEDATLEGPFDRVLSTVPAPQARILLPDLPDVDAQLASVEMAPTWTFMAAFPVRLDAPARLSVPMFRRLSRQETGEAAPDIWVGHANLTWSQAYLEMPTTLVETSLQASFAAALGRLPPEPIYRAVHRWRYAFATKPLGQPFVSALDGRLLIGGDWALGSGSEDAWMSGRAMAAAIG